MSHSRVEGGRGHAGNASENLCEVCSSIDIEALFERECKIFHDIELGSWEQIYYKRSQCPFCRLLVTAVDSVRVATGKNQTSTTMGRERLRCSLKNRIATIAEASKESFVNRFGTGYRSGLSHFRICVSVSGWVELFDNTSAGKYDETFAELQQARPPTAKLGLFDHLPIFTKRLSTQSARQLDYALVKKWVSWCELHHGSQCRPRHQLLEIPVLRVIDVLKNCVVDTSTESRYIALSYVWGSTRILRLTTANQSDLYKEGSLNLDCWHIPQTIRDAMLLTQQLGERYLWVDAICILQDNAWDSGRYISKMDLIYSGASLTIVAAAGTDADAALPGVRPDTRDLKHLQEVVKVNLPRGPQELAVARGLLLPLLASSKWESRGWTYQERVFSHRLLYFTSEQVYFQCRRNTWCEDTVLEVDDPQLRLKDLPLYRFGIPREKMPPALDLIKPEDFRVSLFELYTKVVEGFCQRNLTYEGDVLKAFGGLAREIYHMDGETLGVKPHADTAYFHFGIPSPWFERALLWSPAHSSARSNRRRATTSDAPQMPSSLRRRVMPAHSPQIPSWSWAGWVGPIAYQGLVAAGGDEAILSHISYYTFSPSEDAMELNFSGKLQQIQPTTPATLKSSWPNRLRWCPKERPVHISASTITRSDPTQLLSHLLLFYTSRAFFPVVPEKDVINPAKTSSPATSWSYHYIGKRYSHVTNRILLPSDWLTRASQPLDLKYEFIVLSDNQHGYLNVMMITRCGPEPDAIAERVSVGNVSEQDWVAAEPEWVLVKLG